MISIKTAEEIAILKEGGARLAFILKEVSKKVAVGVSTKDLNDLAEKLIAEGGDKGSFKGYTPHGAKRPYPASLCVSVNEQVVHGIPNESPRILKEGDIVGLDLGLIHKGLFTDHAVTLPVGAISKEAQQLLEVTRKALDIGISAIVPGAHIGDIGAAIKKYVKPFKFGIVETLSGHGVGYSVHEDPFVPNTARKGEGPKLKPGMVLAIEPMLTLGSKEIVLEKDGYTYRTIDGSLAAHFEHTIVVTEDGVEILTI